jgi:lambda repressor-like predicted transcriptional regulator
MTPLEIKIAYMTKGIKFSATARRIGVSPAVVSRVVNRFSWSVTVATAVADDLGLAFDEVFPERVDCLDRRRLSACAAQS